MLFTTSRLEELADKYFKTSCTYTPEVLTDFSNSYDYMREDLAYDLRDNNKGSPRYDRAKMAWHLAGQLYINPNTAVPSNNIGHAAIELARKWLRHDLKNAEISSNDVVWMLAGEELGIRPFTTVAAGAECYRYSKLESTQKNVRRIIDMTIERINERIAKAERVFTTVFPYKEE